MNDVYLPIVMLGGDNMAGTGAYAIPIDMPLVAKKKLKRTMSKEAKAHFDFLSSLQVEVFTDNGELYSKTTDLNTGKSTIRKCEYSDED